MDKNNLIGYIRSLDPSLEPKEGKQFAEVYILPEKLYSFALKLKEDSQTKFDFLYCLTGVDYGNELGIIYHLRSTTLNHEVVLKTSTTDRINPVFDSLSDIWHTAEFNEREVFDLLGIKFTGHPDLRRLFLDNSWGFPLRKDYVDDINIVTK